jgi:lambda family phage tail tape measure protein
VVGVNFAKSFVEGAVSIQSAEVALRTATAGLQSFEEAQSFLLETSNKYGLVYKDQIKGYAQLAASAKTAGMALEDVQTIYLGITEASTALQLSQEDAYGSLRAVVQMMSKGKVQAEELRGQLGERLPGAAQLAAKALGVTDERLNKMLERGQVYAKDFLPFFGQALRDNYGKAAIEASTSAQAAINRLINSFQLLQKAVMFGENFESMKKLFGELASIMGSADFIKGAKAMVAAIMDVIGVITTIGNLFIKFQGIIIAVFGALIFSVSKAVAVWAAYKNETALTAVVMDHVAVAASNQVLAMKALSKSTTAATIAAEKHGEVLKRNQFYIGGLKKQAMNDQFPVMQEAAQRNLPGAIKTAKFEESITKPLVKTSEANLKTARNTAIAAEQARVGAVAAAAASQAGAKASEAAAVGARAAKEAMIAATVTVDAAIAKTAALGSGAMWKGAGIEAAKVATEITFMTKATNMFSKAVAASVGVVMLLGRAIGSLVRILMGPVGWAIMLGLIIYEWVKDFEIVKQAVDWLGKKFEWLFEYVKAGWGVVWAVFKLEVGLVINAFKYMILGYTLLLAKAVVLWKQLFGSDTEVEAAKAAVQSITDEISLLNNETIALANNVDKALQKFGDLKNYDLSKKMDLELKTQPSEAERFKSINKKAAFDADKLFAEGILDKKIQEFGQFAKQIKKMYYDFNTEIEKENRTQADQDVEAVKQKYDEIIETIRKNKVTIKELEGRQEAKLKTASTETERTEIRSEYADLIKDAKRGAGLLIQAEKARESEIAAIRKKERDTYRKEEAALINDLYGLRGQDLEAVIAATKEEEDAVKAKYERLGIITAEGERQLQLIREKGAILANNKRFELAQKEQEIILSTTGLKIDVVRDSVRQIEMRGEAELEALRIEHEKIVKENVGHHDILIAEKARYEAAVGKSKSGTTDAVARAKAALGAIEADTITVYANMLTHEKDRVEKAEAIKQAELIQLKADYDEQVRLHGDSKAQMLIIDTNYEAKKKAAAQKAVEDSRDPLQKWAASYKTTMDLASEWTVQVYEKLSDGIVDAAWEFVEGTKSMKQAFLDFAKSFMKEMTSMILKQAMLNAVKNANNTSGSSGGSAGSGGMISDAVGMVVGWLASEKGNAFDGGKMVAYAKGGVVDKPTMFAMKDGMGLMGEAGPEAVVPLKRMSGGRLGVSYEGDADRRPKQEEKQQVKLEINNISSPEMIERFLTSPRGQNSIMNVVGSNSNKISKMLRI